MPNDLLGWGLAMLVLIVALAAIAVTPRARRPGRCDNGGGGAYAYLGGSRNDDNGPDGFGGDGGGGDGGGD